MYTPKSITLGSYKSSYLRTNLLLNIVFLWRNLLCSKHFSKLNNLLNYTNLSYIFFLNWILIQHCCFRMNMLKEQIKDKRNVIKFSDICKPGTSRRDASNFFCQLIRKNTFSFCFNLVPKELYFSYQFILVSVYLCWDLTLSKNINSLVGII